MKVYLIEAGQYSGTYTVGVATTKENAEAIKRTHDRVEPYYRAHITEFETDTYIPLVEGKSVFRAELSLVDGTIDVDNAAFAYDVGDSDIGVVYPHMRSLAVEVVALDKEHAAKIAQDLFAEYKAKKEGIEL